MFNKILIANRGEIAVRIIRACREMGITSVAICSDVDKDALHAQLADETICIGPAKAKDSYLNMERVLSAAVAADVDAIHPGFGFLSENTKFVKMCEECGITFIGPDALCISKMGDKAEARKTMIKANVPVVPGSEGALYDKDEAKKCADSIGYPVIIKAVSGGGGKGMRIVQDEKNFEHLFETAQTESVNAFSDDAMYIEKYIKNCRHIEFQILADKYGNVVHLGERDCSIQRRHQKMIEETPSKVVDAELRKKMGRDAIKAAKASNYYSAGTVEFIMDEDNNYYFIEMNTRVQVEHPITEMVTGIDIIKEMINIAAGKELPFVQKDIKLRGHSIECRINAEDPDNGFRPMPGTATNIHFPGGIGVRVDSALYNGYKIPVNYDSMIAKIIVHADNRENAVNKMKSALGELIVEGMKTNIDYLYDIVTGEDYINGNVNSINKKLAEDTLV